MKYLLYLHLVEYVIYYKKKEAKKIFNTEEQNQEISRFYQ